MSAAGSRDYLLDVSRLIWRGWRGQLPTGIDRVCLEYVEHFADRALAVVQAKGQMFVLDAASSDCLFQLLLDRPARFRRKALLLAVRATARAKRRPPASRMLYLNVGHTGLHDRSLPRWIVANRIRAVHLVHDIIPLTHPQFCRSGESAKHADRMRNALTSAAGIIANSRATLKDLTTFAANAGLAMPPAIVAWISGSRPAPVITTRTLERPHFISVGTIEGRKNHLLLLTVWQDLVKRMGSESPILAIVGQRGWEAHQATAILDSDNDLKQHVREFNRCEDREVQELTAGARALLMPSFVEGFGLPILEAFQLGTPVIAADLPVYREVFGSLPKYLDPSDAAAWGTQIESFLHDAPERLRQKEAVKSFDAPVWSTHFQKIEAWLGSLSTPARRSTD